MRAHLRPSQADLDEEHAETSRRLALELLDHDAFVEEITASRQIWTSIVLLYDAQLRRRACPAAGSTRVRSATRTRHLRASWRDLLLGSWPRGAFRAWS